MGAVSHKTESNVDVGGDSLSLELSKIKFGWFVTVTW